MPENSDPNLPDLRYVRELAKVFRNYGLDEIEIDTGAQRILLRRGGQGTIQTVAQPVVSAPAPAPAPTSIAPAAGSAAAAAAQQQKEDQEGEFITSPFVGTFYSSPRPDAESFVTAGEQIKAGTTVCIVEAMKLFNEIEAEFPCVVEETLVENATPVEFGAKLFRIKRL